MRGTTGVKFSWVSSNADSVTRSGQQARAAEEIVGQVMPHKLLKVTSRIASSTRYIAVVTMDEVRHVVHLPLHCNPPVAVISMLSNFRRHPRLVKVGAQKPPDLDDVEDVERIHEKNEDENSELFASCESDVWALHAVDIPQTRESPNWCLKRDST